MNIEFGTEVFDKDGKPLGTVNNVIRNSWTGEISKFRVSCFHADDSVMFSPGDILESLKPGITVNTFTNGV